MTAFVSRVIGLSFRFHYSSPKHPHLKGEISERILFQKHQKLYRRQRYSSRMTSTRGVSNNCKNSQLTSYPFPYPPIEPYREGYLEVSKIHKVYYEISGNPEGLPICFIHGGPGGGTSPAHRSFFDPAVMCRKRQGYQPIDTILTTRAVYMIILFDQRGCGKSQPFACLEENTTWDLVDDMERVREAAGIERWVLFGGSWGSTLAIAYAQVHPDRVIGMILRGIFLARESEIEWLYGRNGAAMLFPEAHKEYIAGLPEELRDSHDMVGVYYDLLAQENNSEERRLAANSWSNWERTLSTFPRPERNGDQAADDGEEAKNDNDDEENLAFARIEAHYFVNKVFLREDGYLLKEAQMKKIKHIKTCIVQGRWDFVCPRKSAHDLAQMMSPDCVEVVIVENAGHSTFEPGIEAALLDATNSFGKEFGSMRTNR